MEVEGWTLFGGEGVKMEGGLMLAVLGLSTLSRISGLQSYR